MQNHGTALTGLEKDPHLQTELKEGWRSLFANLARNLCRQGLNFVFLLCLSVNDLQCTRNIDLGATNNF
jgi:hypothetical protein